jgi:hypothetical protein
MKTTTLPIKALLAVIAAIALVPVSPAAASIAFTVAGMAAILLSDYGREIGPLQPAADVVPFEYACRGSAALDTAA